MKKQIFENLGSHWLWVLPVLLAAAIFYGGFRAGHKYGFADGVEAVQCGGGTHVENPWR